MRSQRRDLLRAAKNWPQTADSSRPNPKLEPPHEYGVFKRIGEKVRFLLFIFSRKKKGMTKGIFDGFLVDFKLFVGGSTT